MLTTSTHAEPGANSVLVDYMIVHVVVQSMNKDQEHYEGWRVIVVNIPVLIEKKHFDSQTLSNTMLNPAIE